MISTNYYIVHKSGRRMKITCIGYSHSDDMKAETLKQIAKVEHGRTQDYRIEKESENELAGKPLRGRNAVEVDYFHL